MRPSTSVALATLALTTTLAGCATRTDAPSPVAEPTDASAPQPVLDQDWFFSQDAAEARLVYGVAESDDMRLGLDCARGSGRLTLVALALTGADPEIHLEAGGDTERYRASAEEDPLHDGLMLTARANVTDPVMQRFRRVGWIARWRGGEREVMAPHTEARPDIERFFAFCAG